MAKVMGDASLVEVAGGDGSNLYYFYTSPNGYKDNTIENIAAFAQEHFDSCKDLSVDEIKSKHIFWGTEGLCYDGFYNGDTYILFDDIEKLPEAVKSDAMRYCDFYRNAKIDNVVVNLAENSREYYAYFFESQDEDGIVDETLLNVTDDDIALDNIDAYRENVASFLAQTNESYIDKWDVIHEIYAHEDQPFAYYFEVIDNDWEEVLGNMGEYLDDSENKDMPETIRKGFENIYKYAYDKVFAEESKVNKSDDNKRKWTVFEHISNKNISDVKVDKYGKEYQFVRMFDEGKPVSVIVPSKFIKPEHTGVHSSLFIPDFQKNLPFKGVDDSKYNNKSVDEIYNDIYIPQRKSVEEYNKNVDVDMQELKAAHLGEELNY